MFGSGQPVGGFVLRTKPGQGYVLSMVVDPVSIRNPYINTVY